MRKEVSIRKRICILLTAGLAAMMISGCGAHMALAETTAAAGIEKIVEEEITTEKSEAAGASEAAETEEAAETTKAAETQENTTADAAEETMRIKIEANGNEIIFELNNSQAAKELYGQLPLTVENEDFSSNEKTFYPPEKLDTSDAPMTDGRIGTLAYYEPWGDVVLFYGSYQPNGALYALGKVVSGGEKISEISGEMVISAEE